MAAFTAYPATMDGASMTEPVMMQVMVMAEMVEEKFVKSQMKNKSMASP